MDPTIVWASLVSAIGWMWLELRRLQTAESACQTRLSGVETELRLHRETSEGMHDQNSARFRLLLQRLGLKDPAPNAEPPEPPAAK